MYTGPLTALPPALQMQAALAEAWHVDGRFAQAIAGWETLAGPGANCAEAMLKAAISCFSARLYEQGFSWLSRASQAGALAEETLYVRAQSFWQQRRVREAIALFQEAEQAAPRLGKASNALGVLYWQLACSEKAARQFTLALQRDPGDGEALVNVASLSIRCEQTCLSALQEAGEMLAAAAARLPQRAEAFVWYARLLRRMCREEEAREALARARLRGPFRGAICCGWTPTAREASGRVRVCGTFSPAHALLTLRYTYPPGAAPSLYLAVNRGYEQVTAGGHTLVPVPVEQGAGLPVASNIVCYALPASAWQHVDEALTLEVTVVGRPLPPCVTLGAAEIELDGRSGWLPWPLPPLSFHWQIDVQFPPDMALFPSTDEAEEAPGLIALRHPTVYSPEAERGAGGRVSALACKDSPLLRLAPLLMQRTIALWESRLGALCGAWPALIVVDQPASLFCYARKRYLRLPSGLARRLECTAQICHEVGHLWWGLQVRFAATDAWLGEALAEYSLHLAQEAGWLTGYRSNALALLRTLGQGTLPAAGLSELHGSPGRAASYSLRVKGGYVIAMLRTLMGETAFWNFLRAVYELGSEQCLDAYQFFALASRWHGASLNWFVNQWVYATASLAFAVEDCRLTQTDAVFALAFTVRCRGVATPGGPVTVAIACEGGEERRLCVNLNLGRASIALTLPTRPQKVLLDPDLCWYAEQGEKILSGGSL